MSGQGRGFPWRWIIAGLALCVISLTIFVPPPGPASETDREGVPENSTDASGEPAMHDAEVAGRSVPDTVRILVLNGTQTQDLAQQTQSELIVPFHGDSIVVYSPWDPSDTESKPYPETIIKSHSADISGAMAIADRLGLPYDCIVWEVPVQGTDGGPDITVCLGADQVDGR